MPSRKEMRELHIKRIFVDAAKEYITAHGVGSLTVKAVADLAGYAPGTLYNYFADLQELLYECAKDFFHECTLPVKQRLESCTTPVERVVAPALVYTQYFLEHPDVFHLLFVAELGEAALQDFQRGTYVPEVIQLQQQHLQECVQAGFIGRENAETISGLISNTVHSNLLFYLKGRLPVTSAQLIEKTGRELNFLFTP